MSIDLDRMVAKALGQIKRSDPLLITAPAVAIVEMFDIIRRQEKELIEARERRSEPSAVRVTIVDERASRLPVVPASEPLPPHAALIDHGATFRIHMPVKYGSPAQTERRQGLDMVDHRLRQILNPPTPFHGEKWAAADALYWLTGDQAFADQADGLAAESLKGEQKPILAGYFVMDQGSKFWEQVWPPGQCSGELPLYYSEEESARVRAMAEKTGRK